MLSFALAEEFVASYAGKPVNWGFPAGGGNSLGELVFLRTYSRKKADGSKERWHETVERVVNGTYSIMKDYCYENGINWDEEKAQRSAKEMYDRIFQFKFTPPGRGLQMMGTPAVHERRNAGFLQNCGWCDTSDLPKSMRFLMEASAHGVGVGFNTNGGNLLVVKPNRTDETHIVDDSREGWAESVFKILKAFTDPLATLPRFDYSQIRPKGAPISSFASEAPGPEPLIDLNERLDAYLSARIGQKLGPTGVVDIANLVGRAVVAGGSRRSAEIALSDPSEEYLDLKDYGKNPQRSAWGWASNNSIFAEVGMDYTELAKRAQVNGEPGLFYPWIARDYGRLIDEPNYKEGPDSSVYKRKLGINPCGEQILHDMELCTLVETFPNNHEDLEDYLRTLKFAYLYGKTVTLLPVPWAESRKVMERNRRIGTSMSGIVQLVHRIGVDKLKVWADEGYREIQRWDRVYSDWLRIPLSIKTTSVKPSGTTSLLCGATPGVHYPTHRSYIRRMIVEDGSPLARACEEAGYPVEPSKFTPNSVVIEFPVSGPDVPTESEVSMWDKAQLAATMSEWWADNSVSCTITFDPATEGPELGKLMEAFEGRWKSVSFLPMHPTGAYDQLPYEAMEESVIRERQNNTIKLSDLYTSGTDADLEAEKYCSTDHCVI